MPRDKGKNGKRGEGKVEEITGERGEKGERGGGKMMRTSTDTKMLLQQLTRGGH